jgi:acetyl-CoA hydrolase
MNHPIPILTAEEAAELIPNGATIGFSGFSPAGSAKAIPRPWQRERSASAPPAESSRWAC